MNVVSREAERRPGEVSPLYELGKQMCVEPDGFKSYNEAKILWLGHPERTRRLAGEHPWPTRVRDGEEYVFSVPVLAGFNAETQRILFVGKDNWKPDDNHKAWLVIERGLLEGEEIEHKVLSVRVDAAGQLRIVLAPPGFDNFPPLMQEALRNQPASEQIMLLGRLDEQYTMSEATLRDGLDGQTWPIDDIEKLEKMIVGIQQLESMERDPQALTEELRALGGRALVSAGVQCI